MFSTLKIQLANCSYFYENQIAELCYIQLGLGQTKNLLINMEIRVMMMFCIIHLSVGAVIKTWNYQILYQRNCFYLLVAIVCNFLINLNLIPALKHQTGWYKLIKSLWNSFKHHKGNIIKSFCLQIHFFNEVIWG